MEQTLAFIAGNQLIGHAPNGPNGAQLGRARGSSLSLGTLAQTQQRPAHYGLCGKRES